MSLEKRWVAILHTAFFIANRKYFWPVTMLSWKGALSALTLSLDVTISDTYSKTDYSNKDFNILLQKNNTCEKIQFFCKVFYFRRALSTAVIFFVLEKSNKNIRVLVSGATFVWKLYWFNLFLDKLQ